MFKLLFLFTVMVSIFGPAIASDTAQVPGIHIPLEKSSVKEARKGRYQQLVEFDAKVKRIKRDNDLVVSDESGSVSVDVGEMPLPLKVGDPIRIIGRVDKDFGTEIYATRVIIGGKTVEIARKSYED
jgi:uncharacterized protein YdeI (BOF family)